MKCITISGGAGHGKDTLANQIKMEVKKQGKKAFIIHYADYLKMIATQVYGWNGEKDEEGRTLLQKLGDKMRAKNKTILIDELIKILLLAEDEFDVALIADARLPEEIDYLKGYWNSVISIHVNRVDFENTLTDRQKGHKTETALKDYIFDYKLHNRTNEVNPALSLILMDILS